LGMGPDEAPVEEADPDLFKSIVNAVIDHQEQIDETVRGRLADGWKLSRLDATTRAILRAGAAELIAHQELSNAIIIKEYVDLAHDFFDGSEPKFVNGVMDKMAGDLRPA